MKAKLGEELLAILQRAVSTALGHWLDENKAELLRSVREAVLKSEAAHREPSLRQIKLSEFLTVPDVARRWRLHPESVRRMIREDRLPRVMVGRQIRVSLHVVEAFETKASRIRV